MPRGRYSLHDPHDRTRLAEERFQCAPGPSGWRYSAQLSTASGDPYGAVDLTVDRLWRPIRLELQARGWQVRGAALNGVTWVRTDAGGMHAREGNAHAPAFSGNSPAFLVTTARLLGLTPSAPSGRIRLVAFTEPVLAPRTVDQDWTLLNSRSHPTDSGPLIVREYRVTDLSTGESGSVHLSGDVVLAAPGVELEELESPPSTLTETGSEEGPAADGDDPR
ncbi:hypothetical protein [Streptomyces sp. TP-A0874]|uniref:hypothetical protein n=1 Tax=Streptomyces sp. TP-A0874 TaxID=549819 RepID=UPI0008529EAF|nr:hypothetical protein [Streptomyces sp. TP-A0874]